MYSDTITDYLDYLNGKFANEDNRKETSIRWLSLKRIL